MPPRVVAVIVSAVLAGPCLAGCDRALRRASPDHPAPARSAPARSAPETSAASPSVAAAAPSFGELVALPCAGRPGVDAVVALLRRTPGAPPSSVAVTVQSGPLCAGGWQYTVVLPDRREPLQVVTRGEPDALTMVTAGTDVCTIEVRSAAPQGIRSAAHC